MCSAKLKQRSWSLLSLQPPFGFFSFIFFLSFVTTNCSLSGKNDFLADEIIVLTLSRPVFASQLVFLWWTPLKALILILKHILSDVLPFSDVKNPWTFYHNNLKLFLETMVGNLLQRPIPVVIIKLENILKWWQYISISRYYTLQNCRVQLWILFHSVRVNAIPILCFDEIQSVISACIDNVRFLFKIVSCEDHTLNNT